jgi:hypothetical protein
VVRRFDTRTITQTVMPTEAEEAGWLSNAMLKRAVAETVWEGALDDVMGEAPLGVPPGVWTVARALVSGEKSDREASPESDDLDRHVIGRRLRLTCIPVTHVEYTFDGRELDFTAVGPSSSERFWAESFPARWTRVGRFFKAVMRDLNGERGPSDERRRLPDGAPRPLDEWRARHVRILPDTADQPDADSDADINASAEADNQPPPPLDDDIADC